MSEDLDKVGQVLAEEFYLRYQEIAPDYVNPMPSHAKEPLITTFIELIQLGYIVPGPREPRGHG